MGSIQAKAAPAVSVITAAYNASATIEAAIASVRNQSIANWEMVVCDDGSADDTAARVRAVASEDKRVRLVRNGANAGLAAARNHAIEHASAEQLAFLDADDAYESTYLATMLERLDGTVDIGIVCCDAWLEDVDGHRLGRYSTKFGVPDGIDLRRLLKSNPIFVSVVCPAAVIDQAGRFAPECAGATDLDLWLRIVELGWKVSYVSEPPLITYRISEKTMSKDRLRMAQADRVVFSRALERGRLAPRERRIARARLQLATAAELRATNDIVGLLPQLPRALLSRAVLRLKW